MSSGWGGSAGWLIRSDGSAAHMTLIRVVPDGIELTDPRVLTSSQQPWRIVVAADSPLGKVALVRLSGGTNE